MKLYSIKDGYLFKTDNPEGTHTYAVWYERKRKQYVAVPTTHLYKQDPKRKRQMDAGFLMYHKFPGILLPSGVKNYAHTTDVNGKKIDVKNPQVKELSKKHLPKTMAQKIKEHANARFSVRIKKKNSHLKK